MLLVEELLLVFEAKIGEDVLRFTAIIIPD